METNLSDQAMEQVLTQPQHPDQGSSLWEESSTTYTKELITEWPQFHAFLEELKQQSIFAYDTETNGKFDRFEVQLVGMSFCWDESKSYYLPFHHFDGKQLDIRECLEALKPIFEGRNYAKICHNAKFDEMVMSRHGIDVQGPGHDTYIMAWMLSEDSGSKGLKPLTEKHFGVEMETYEDVISSAPKKKNIPRDYNFARVGLAEALSYAADDAYWTLRLYNLFKPQIEAQKLWGPYNNVERPFGRVLRKLEARGVFIDQELLTRADQRLPKLAEEVEASIYEQAGEVFNIGSPPQLGNILFGKLGIGKNVPRSPKTGNFSTNKKTLELYAGKHQIVNDVLRRKKIEKTHSTFVKGTKGFIGKDGRVHPSFNGCGTVTGRLSCSSPNLQQIEGDEVEEIRVRNFFVPAPGYRFVVADYGQVELRIMAHFAKDQNMIDAFLSGRDFHEETARKMFNIADDVEVVHRQRFAAKAINFGIGYGRGPMSIAEQVGCSLGEAKDFIAGWGEAFPNVIAFKAHTVAQARKYGYIRTLTGRKRRLLPDIRSNDWGLRGRAERQAFNTKIQGSAADIIKMAMLSLAKVLPAYDAHMAVQIHDELVIEVPIETAEEVRGVVTNTMMYPINNTNPLRLPLVVDPKIVDRWGDAK